jgi:hypothetical protein
MTGQLDLYRGSNRPNLRRGRRTAVGRSGEVRDPRVDEA